MWRTSEAMTSDFGTPTTRASSRLLRQGSAVSGLRDGCPRPTSVDPVAGRISVQPASDGTKHALTSACADEEAPPCKIRKMHLHAQGATVTHTVTGIGSVGPTHWRTSFSRHTWFETAAASDRPTETGKRVLKRISKDKLPYGCRVKKGHSVPVCHSGYSQFFNGAHEHWGWPQFCGENNINCRLRRAVQRREQVRGADCMRRKGHQHNSQSFI